MKFAENDNMRKARLQRMLLTELTNDTVILDENGELLIFERDSTPKDIEHLRPVGEIDITHELELLKKMEEKMSENTTYLENSDSVR